MRLKTLSIVLALVGSALVPAPVLAGPFQLNFAGHWGFYDPYSDQPDFWAAMNGSGVFTGTPLTLSMIVNDRDLNADPTAGSYTVLNSQLRVGGVVLSSTPTALHLSGFGDANVNGGWVGAPAGLYTPTYMQLSYWGGLPATDRLIDVIPYLNAAPNNLFIGYSSGSCSLCLGVSQVRLTSVHPVPEPSSVLLLGGGLVLLAGRRFGFLPRLRREGSRLR